MQLYIHDDNGPLNSPGILEKPHGTENLPADEEVSA